MSIFDYFRSAKKDTASIAKERLQIIVAHERNQRNKPDYLPKLQQELLEVIRKYVDVDQDQVEVQLDNNGNCSVLELNITLPERA
ncbi:MAG: cell division topological specificity factor [Zhongshania marina]|jgi:cell division topological specificity factor|uniref:Cell division topological specificity factor n=1 Tax=Zhongshania marina TaxID=2304603 RepID=A0A2S4HJ00_9GAMM|nr:cell division topological specificity factor MinE [Marortus luteolus]POP53974.1 cell division topological specificity factor MinE [Marortus luteolus]RNL66698.1 cell division topological specificity factor MinE [Zhongshania marina]